MSDIAYDDQQAEADNPLAGALEKPDAPASQQAQVAKILDKIKSDKEFHKNAFKRMRKSMFMAHHGRDETWAESNYTANFAGRHVKQKTASLYAKNPTATAVRNDRMDFTVWDEDPKSLEMAMQLTQQAAIAAQEAAAQPPQIDPMTGMAVPVQPQLPPGFEDAQAIIADYQQGMQRRQLVDKISKTLEILFAKFLRLQKPLKFKTAAKALVRRACTCGVGYIELGFVRETGPRTGIADELADARGRLDHLRRLTTEALNGDITEDDAEMAELEASIAALQSEPEIVLREGLTFDFPQATSVIPDKLTKQLVGFVGARHVAIEYLFTCEQVEEMFPEADIRKGGYRGYGSDGKAQEGAGQLEIPFDNDEEGYSAPSKNDGNGLVCVYKFYDKMSGLVYYVADGHKEFLRPPAAPDVFVDDFWPIYALTFNAGENEKELFPKSDVELLWHQQTEHNRSRQGMREHRKAARPRWATSAGAFLDEDGTEAFKTAEPFDVIELNKDPATKLADVLEVIPVPGVDPNLYQTEQFEADRQLVVGASDASMGGISKATATETAISANSTLASDESSKDDLDDFLSEVARSASQILFGEMSEEQVKLIVGPGAVWPQQTLAEIANDVFLEVEAGSSGRPNQAVEIENYTKIVPMLIQIPGINPVELAKEGIRRLGDKLDVNKFLMPGVPSITSLNSQPQPGTGDPATDPNQQGGQGGQNAPQAPGQSGEGTGPSFGSNQVSRPAA